MNRSLIFSLLFPSSPRSRADIIRLTGLSRVAVSDVVGDMLTEGLIREDGVQEAAGKGKRAALLAVDPTRLHVITIDLSQDRIVEGAVTDLTGRTREHMEITLERERHIDVDAIIQLADQLRADIDPRTVIGVGVAATGVVSDGVVRLSTALDWRDVDLAGQMEARLSLPVTVVNDAVAAMFTERFLGEGGPNLIFVKLGQGLASATLIDDVPAFGEHHAGGEIGHISLDPDTGARCPCGKRGCMETLISAPALRARMDAAADESGREDVVREGGRYLASALAMSMGLLDIVDICLYGPDDIINDTFLHAAQTRMDQMTASAFHQRTRIRRCRFDHGAALRGAAMAAVLRHIEAPHP